MSYQGEYTHSARHIAEEQALFLRSRYQMQPDEIVSLYTGQECIGATYEQAINSIYEFNVLQAKNHGFLAS